VKIPSFVLIFIRIVTLWQGLNDGRAKDTIALPKFWFVIKAYSFALMLSAFARQILSCKTNFKLSPSQRCFWLRFWFWCYLS